MSFETNRESVVNYQMKSVCLLRRKEYHTTAWVDSDATKLGLLEIPELGGLWEIVEIYPYRLSDKQLKTHRVSTVTLLPQLNRKLISRTAAGTCAVSVPSVCHRPRDYDLHLATRIARVLAAGTLKTAQLRHTRGIRAVLTDTHVSIPIETRAERYWTCAAPFGPGSKLIPKRDQKARPPNDSGLPEIGSYGPAEQTTVRSRGPSAKPTSRTFHSIAWPQIESRLDSLPAVPGAIRVWSNPRNTCVAHRQGR
jgi:hypothetical protein